MFAVPPGSTLVQMQRDLQSAEESIAHEHISTGRRQSAYILSASCRIRSFQQSVQSQLN